MAPYARAYARRSRGRRYGRAKAPAVFTLMGGIAFTGGLVLGYTAAELIHRYAVTYAAGTTGINSPSSNVTTLAQYNAYATEAKPTWASIGMQAGLAFVGILGGVYLPWNAAKLLSYGIGFGATAHVVGQAVEHHLLMPIFASGANGPRLFANETAADAALYPATPPTTATVMQGDPPLTSRRGTPVAAAAPALPEGKTLGRVPHALATSMMGAVASTPGIMNAGVARGMVAQPQKQQQISTLTQNTAPPSQPTSLSNGGSSVGGGGGSGTGGGGGTSMVGGGGGLTDGTPPASIQPPVAPQYHKTGCSCSGCHSSVTNAVNARIGEVPEGDGVHPMIASQYRRRAAGYPRRAA
jgi:uncharacterized membrane protein YgcG